MKRATAADAKAALFMRRFLRGYRTDEQERLKLIKEIKRDLQENAALDKEIEQELEWSATMNRRGHGTAPTESLDEPLFEAAGQETARTPLRERGAREAEAEGVKRTAHNDPRRTPTAKEETLPTSPAPFYDQDDEEIIFKSEPRSSPLSTRTAVTPKPLQQQSSQRTPLPPKQTRARKEGQKTMPPPNTSDFPEIQLGRLRPRMSQVNKDQQK
ncbi:hypothetical protein CB0940_05189 [Cercospora beticola]|uniref:Uncharacterized protein n=1 Tax=Cercospora beticola TaxID=122368 RepID=A0A2G5HJL8_CERBT|nr:hypothetical protein CB0940_05189 [Cercospora beticola]PIA92728.1 hypothetical protein CB0940_05189 [Cercospora beticola]WPB02505.1 hypothetical protein RHO25_007141 [Cercospora beticola]CAK1362601.1 unnamed protein product [Cercospora beticola]